jgi:hypothetical protein
MGNHYILQTLFSFFLILLITPLYGLYLWYLSFKMIIMDIDYKIKNLRDALNNNLVYPDNYYIFLMRSWICFRILVKRSMN